MKKKLDTYMVFFVYSTMKNDKKINKKGNKTI